MLQHAIALLLQRLLGKFVSFDSSMLKLSLWQGDLSFQDLQLRLSYGKGTIGHLSVRIPWRALWTQSVQIKAEYIRVSLHQTPKMMHHPEVAELDLVDTSIDGSNGDDRTYLSRLVSHIIANVHIELSDVQLRYDCDPSSRPPVIATQSGSGTFEIGHMTLINTNSKWELDYTQQSSSAVESNKLLSIEGVAAYIEYPGNHCTRNDKDENTSPVIMRRYLFHEWRSTVKASLYYHSVNAAFPHVELDVDVGCVPGRITDTCELCASHRVSGNEKFNLKANQPRMHFGPEHIDVFYAILIEVKAPYDEFERLAALTQQQASRPDGFLMVLSYAKQWLLIDCLNSVVGETYTLAAGIDDDDDDDEFEDAITPPSLSVRAELRHGAGIFFSARENCGTKDDKLMSTQWVWLLGRSVGTIKQSCVEDEANISIQSFRMYEVEKGTMGYSIVDHLSQHDEHDGPLSNVAPIIRILCIIPAYQSRLVGHQATLNFQSGSVMASIKDETLILWMDLFAPVYLWWNQWNTSHPKRLITFDEAQIAPIAHVRVRIERICFVFVLHDHLCFNIELAEVVVETFEHDGEIVKSDTRARLRLFSSNESLALLQAEFVSDDVSNSHVIIAVDQLLLTKTSHSRANWSSDNYPCKHCTLGDHGTLSLEQHDKDYDEIAMYNYEAQFSVILMDWIMEELEAICWILGKWSFLLPNSFRNGPIQDLHRAKGCASINLACQQLVLVRIPELKLCITDDRSNQPAMLVLSIKDVDCSSRFCTTAVSYSVSMLSVFIQEGERDIFSVTGSPGNRKPALRLSYCIERAYTFKSGAHAEILQFVSRTTQVVISVERLSGVIFLPNVKTILAMFLECQNIYLLGFILSTSYAYDTNTYRRNMKIARSQTSLLVSKDSSSIDDNLDISLVVAHGLEIYIKHRDQTPGNTFESLSPIKTIALIGISKMSLQASGSRASAVGDMVLKVKGSIRNLQLTDLTDPSGPLPAGARLPNRQAIGSSSDSFDEDADVGQFGIKNVIEFALTSFDNSGTGLLVRVRLDSVCVVYLHRVFKQFYHYVYDHVVDAFEIPPDKKPSCERAVFVLKNFKVDTAALTVPFENLLGMYFDAAVTGKNMRASVMEMAKGGHSNTRFEIVGNDMAFALPRSSFSRESVILRSTHARFWSSGIDPLMSEFLQKGTFADESRLSRDSALAGASAVKAKHSRRPDLRNLRRQIRNQRSRFLSNRSQLFIDLRSATQQAHNYLHEGFQTLPAAEDAVKIIRHKILELDQQLEQLTQYSAKVDEALDKAKTESEALDSVGRNNLHFLTTASLNGLRGRSDWIEQILDEVAGMSQYLMTPLFVSEDAEFHDARVALSSNTMVQGQDSADMSTSSVGLFEFELVDFCGTTRNSASPLFRHSLLSGHIDLEPESLSEAILSSYYGISLSLNELSLGITPEQYTTCLGIAYENFRENSRVVTDDTYPLCAACGGLHFVTDYCRAIWIKVLVKVADAALRISNKDHSIADMFYEQLELVFTLRTDDSLEFYGSALSFTTVDIRPTHCQTASEIIRPLPGDGLQIEYNQKLNWTDSFYDLKLKNTNFLGVYPAFHDIVSFFADPIITEGEFLEFGIGFLASAPPNWRKIDFYLTTKGCLFSLLEDFKTSVAHALLMLTDVVAAYSARQNLKDSVSTTKCHLEFDQHGVYFSQLPDLQIDASFPLSNAFLLVFDHFVEGTATLSRRNSFVLAPVETRFSVQDANLFANIANNYLQSISSSSRSISAKSDARRRSNSAPGSQMSSPIYVADKLLGDVGELRLVLVNNSLGIPIADFHMRDIVCEYIQEEEYSTTMGATLLFNFFNNSIYRWEPLVEPFIVQMRIHRALEEKSIVEVYANLPNTINFNITPAMAPLLSSDALRQADFVTSGSKSTAPFWVENKTGLGLAFSFRRGIGTIIQQNVAVNGKVSVDCREQGDMLSFDSASADRFLREADRQALTVNHTLSVWLNGNRWVSANPVIVDMVGHVAVPLRESLVPVVGVDTGDCVIGGDEDTGPPTLVAEISIQADGSKLISLHSQLVLQNRTSVPLMVWAFSPRDGGCIQEWVIDREELVYIPLQLVHPQSKISIRPSPYVQYAPLTTSLEELGDEVRTAKAINTKRFVRAGSCVCNFETLATMDESESAARSLELVASCSMSSAIPLTGYVVRDLPTWKCAYEVEAYYLMRATFSCADEPQLPEKTLFDRELIEEEGGNEEDEFLNMFVKPTQRQRLNSLRDINYELDEARTAGQRRGLYEATNSSLYYLSVSPFLTLHNRLATAIAYRLLSMSLQLIAEGVLAVGNLLPLFQIDAAELLYISLRLENYSWSIPRPIINPMMSAYTVPYKERIESIQLLGRAFDRDIIGEQGSVPNLQLQVKLSGRDVIISCSIWIVNHTGLDLEYCNSTASSAKRLENVYKYVHQSAGLSEQLNDNFSLRSLSFHGEGNRETQLVRLQKIKPSANPVAVVVVVREAKNLYNSQYFGAQNPYVRVSLYVLKNPKERYLEKPEMVVVCSTTTKPSPSGGVNPQWNSHLRNTLLLRFPFQLESLELSRIIVEVRNIRYGLDTCLGVAAVKLDSILKNRKRAAAFNWYKLLKRNSSREQKASKNNLASIHRGDVSISFSVGTSQELPSDMDVANVVEDNSSDRSSPLGLDDEMMSSYLQDQSSKDIDLEDIESFPALNDGPLPSTRGARSLQRHQTPTSQDRGVSGTVSTMRARHTGEFELAHPQEMLSYDPTSTRAMGASILDGSPTKLSFTEKSRGILVYLPHNRFACVTVEVCSSNLMSEVFDRVCIKCGFTGVLDIKDFQFYELALPRFVSLRSAGRPESERWYGLPISITSKVESKGRRHGFHLCHRMTMTTIRLYDEASTASSHHMTPRSLVSSSKRSNPAQIRPMSWGAVLPYSSGGKHWDVLRIKSRSSPWSDVIRLNRNAMGNSGVAQVISLTNEVYDQDQESEPRKGSQEVALWSCYGSGRYSETIMATIVPRYILINKTEETIKYRQVDAPQTFRLGANELVPFHWPSAAQEKLLKVTLLQKYSWSGSFQINSIGTTYLKLRDREDSSRIYILQCQIELIGGSVALIFRPESKRFPPYRIDNMTSFRIRYKQTNWGDDNSFDELLPRSSCPYSWDYLNGVEGKPSSASSHDPAFPGTSSSCSRSLQVRFMRVTSSTSHSGEDLDKDAVEVREFNLDEMTSHKRIQLHRSLPSELFLKPEQKGYLLKKDSMLKWNRKYFRLYEHVLYYFSNESDQELLGVVNLRTGSDVPGVGGVAIFEKTAEVPLKSGFISLNGFVSSISGSLFGGGSRQLDGGGDDDDDEDDRARELLRLAVSLVDSTLLCKKSEYFVSTLIKNDAGVKSGNMRPGFYVNSEDLVEYLTTEMCKLTRAQALTTAQEMMQIGILKTIQISSGIGARRQAPMRKFQCSKSVWYSVDSINIADESDVDLEDTTSMTTPRDLSEVSCKSGAKLPIVRSNQFTIITPTKCYDLKAKNSKIAKIWVRRLRLATIDVQNDDSKEALPVETPNIGAALSTLRSHRDIAPPIQNAKTFVHVRIRADGPTKVLELSEGGEEDFDEKDNKYEASVSASVTSDSPTACEISTTSAFVTLTRGVTLHLCLDGVGVSCVNEFPTELVYIYLGGINLHYSRINSNMRMSITLDDLQIDNQSEEATFTKLLCPRGMDIGGVAAATFKRRRQLGDIDESLAEMEKSDLEFANERDDDEFKENTGLISNQTVFICADCKYRQANVAAMHFCCTWSIEQGNTEYFKHCSFWLYPVTTQLDEELLASLRAFMAAMSQSWGRNRSQNRSGEIRMKCIPTETMLESLAEYQENTQSDELNPLLSLKSYTMTSTSETRKVYFALLHIHPMDFDITFRSDVFQTSTTLSLHEANTFKKSDEEMKRSNSAPTTFSKSNGDEISSVSWAIPSLTMHVPDLDNAPVRLNALMIEHAFGTSSDLTRRVSKYYTRQLWKQLHKILGSFDFLGNPVGFLDHIGTGVRDFVYEPLEGLKIGGKGFSKGLARGTASLMSNTVDGTFDAASKISGTFGQGFANLSLDDHYQQNRARARRRHVRGLREGLIQGSRELSLGVYEGVAGLVLNPMRGAHENGAVGFVRGTITGIIGLPVKPVAGIFDFASRATQGVRNRSLQNGQNMRRVRRPRVFGRYNELKCYKEADTIAYELLKRVGGDRLSGEKIIFYNEIVQLVSAADLTRAARDRRRSGNIGSGKPKSSDSTRARTNSLRIALQEDDERRRAAGETLDAGPGERSSRKLRYEVTFHKKLLGLDLETDFYCENVTIKVMDERRMSKVKMQGHIAPGQQVLQKGDCLIGVGGVDVRGIGFHETLALLRGTPRPITVQFESAEELMQEVSTPTANYSSHSETEGQAKRRISVAGPGCASDAMDMPGKQLKVQLAHWLIVTEQRVLYINVGSYTKPVVEWMTPLRYIYRVEWQKSAAQISLHLSVGVDSLPMGPRLQPSLKALDGHERDMNVFLDVMWHSFRSATAEQQELWPSDTSLNGYLLKKGGFSTVRRWFVLSRNCLYYFSSRKQLRGIIPLGNVRLEMDGGDTQCLRITNAIRSQPLVTLQLDSGQVVERVQSEVVLVAAAPQELEMWHSSLAHAAGKGMRHSRGTRYFNPTAASRLEIGTQETPDFVVSPLAEALQKTVEVFNTKLPQRKQ